MHSLEETTRRELEAAGRTNTVYGQLALILARRIDGPSTDTGSSIAALAKVWRDATATALEGVKQELSPLDRIRAERDARPIVRGRAPGSHGA